jgi:hypothetical protein
MSQVLFVGGIADGQTHTINEWPLPERQMIPHSELQPVVLKPGVISEGQVIVNDLYHLEKVGLRDDNGFYFYRYHHMPVPDALRRAAELRPNG